MTMADSPPIPPEIWERLLEFIRARKTGQIKITLDVNDGRVLGAGLEEYVRTKVRVVDSRP